jgi:exopolysaccharide production protein ExoQ
LWMSVSKTSIGFMIPSLFIGIIAHYAYKAPRTRAFGFMCLGIVLIGAAALYGNQFMMDYVQPTLADPTSFTGRSPVWQVVLDYAADHLWLGAGYGSFWGIGINSPVLNYTMGWITEVYSSHDGYLNVLVTIGLPGMIYTIAVLFVYPLYLGFFGSLSSELLRSMLVSIIAFIALHDLLEESILEPAAPTWTLLLITYSLFEKETGKFQRSYACPNPPGCEKVPGRFG